MAPYLQSNDFSAPGDVVSWQPETPLTTIEDWRAVQSGGHGGLARLLSIAKSERSANAETHAWVSLASAEQIREQWEWLESQRTLNDALPLFGVPFAVKDNIDVRGFPTTAACPAFAAEPATSDAPVVAKLRAAGAIVIGKTNMDQFATGLVGTRSPHGAVPNAFDPARVSGGSSSGSGVVVARGVVPFSLGTDTAGSGRVPAGLNNIIGLKPTRGALSARGVLPACRTLDCVSIFALTVEDAQTVLSVAEGYDGKDSYSRSRPSQGLLPAVPTFGTASLGSRPPSLAICSQPDWYGRDDQAPAYEAALCKARALGWRLTPIDFSDLFALAKLLYEGPWVAERFVAIRDFIEQASEKDMDPVVRGIVAKARHFSAADAFASEYARQDLARQIAMALADFDGLLVPTAPTFPTIEQVLADPVRENSLLGTYTNFVNFLDWSAISIPAGFRRDGLPFGITLISSTWQEPKLLGLSQQWLSGARTRRRLGATKAFREADVSSAAGAESLHTPIAVVGAHLTGFPLNKDLVSRGARLDIATKTAPMYRLYELSSGEAGPKKPGLERVTCPGRGQQIAVEVWQLPCQALASFMATIPPPLAIGSIELADGRWVHGFVCEPVGLRGARDITQFGGWEAYMQHSAKRQVSRVLIANRGEIAARIVRTLRKMNIEAVSIYTDVDADTPHVRDADLSLRLEGDSVAETYLNASQVIRLAESARVDAIIPGYGFLAESAEFAQAVEDAGFVWIGPTPEQMSDLGLKHRAREIAAAAGVAVVPGSTRLATSLSDACEEAERLGFPLMLKSTAGGGGIGLRCCHDSEALADAFNAVQRLAAVNFGESGVFLERYIENARHIEVQILGDGNGRVLALSERDCSLQRRHQKVVEECPAFAVPLQIRASMRAAAVRLAAAVKYRNVGTVEFIYDLDSQEYYLLEVNTRLQVEHPVTEAVTGLDLVECMLQVARDDCNQLFSDKSEPIAQRGASIEVRLYAESPLENFRPCAGTITDLAFPSHLRVDTWIDVGTPVSTRFDPLLAKIIATGGDRLEALRRLAAGLKETRIGAGNYTTKSLDSFQPHAPSLQVVEAGAMTTIQDYPGRTGFWSVGIPPSGPMDHLSFRLANRLVNNSPDVAAIEWLVENGYRVYVAVAGGIQVPKVMGSRATFEVGSLGWKDGSKLHPGDIIPIGTGQLLKIDSERLPACPAIPIPDQPSATWTIGVVPGPHGAPDYFTQDGLTTLFAGEWRVHHNSNRLGVRLTGPRPQWARQTGGEAGIHPSNIHDSPYSIGSISFTGDEAVVLTCDGPSLGGFVVFCVVASAEMWKMGQVRPGDTIRLRAVDTALAKRLDEELNSAIQNLTELPRLENLVPASDENIIPISPMVEAIHYSDDEKIVARQAGDRAMILEFGQSEIFDLGQSFKIQAFCQQHAKTPIEGIDEVTPGVRTIHLIHTAGLSPRTIIDRLSLHVSSYHVPTRIASRTLHLPLAFDDSVCRAAVDRYAASIRSEAPWLPSNVTFLEELNGLDDMSALLYDATFLVLGLGDVFLGSPCAVPLDPRHRLFGTKYNPSRSFTPRRSLVGRTVDIWDPKSVHTGDTLPTSSDPWLFRPFDRIKFYCVKESELDAAPASELIRIIEGELNLAEYEAWIESQKDDIATTAAHRQESISRSPFLEELRQPYQPKAVNGATVCPYGASDLELGSGGEKVKAMMPGRCYNFVVKEQSIVKKGEILMWIESSKMEIEIRSPVSGICKSFGDESSG
ncbi:amidase domain-containing protein [Hirsutella rhossiliensis]|uniref:Amidase domain-containing protein n=1 Tax=Hirsutella rhossiliensis TaxID=111463 RepID=A0A9P8MR41_9HYPO|nr:amidase domain-containing protein [Hirsutella rhossiliensis]KAH0959542.1 amidase domain-containing protein [Hirsutella rhossiliensis]